MGKGKLDIIYPSMTYDQSVDDMIANENENENEMTAGIVPRHDCERVQVHRE